ncbi:MAG: hypothetical protein RSC10_04085 [Longicatena sp.]
MKIKKEEKLVFFIGIIVIVAVVGFGFARNNVEKKSTYEPIKVNNSEVTSQISLKNELVKVALNAQVSSDPATYILGDGKDIKNVVIDVSAVDTKTQGTYKATATLKDQKLDFQIQVGEALIPVFKVVHPSFQFVFGEKSTMQEVIDFAGVKAIDGKGNDLSASITGWEKEMPKQAGTIVYKLSVKDANGLSAQQKITVQFIAK